MRTDNGGVRSRTWCRSSVIVAAAALAAGVLGAAGPAGAGTAPTAGAPGVTVNSITVGTISTQTGPIASNFSSLIYGEKAYFDYINARGGVNGRKINYRYALDDGGSGTYVQPAGQHADQSGPRVRGDRRGHRVLHAQLLRRGEDPHLRLRRDRELGRAEEPLRRRWVGHLLPRRGRRARPTW